MNTAVLICDDNISVHKSLSAYLKKINIRADSCYSGTAALKMLRQKFFSFFILDLMLPDLSGFDVLKELRTFTDVPVMILSAMNSEEERILGLKLGADDYVCKPFSPLEVTTRIQVILRRSRRSVSETENVLSFSNLTIDQNTYHAFVDNEPLELTPLELGILAFFITRPNQVFSREQIIDNVWKYDYYGDIRTVDTQINHIRKKMPDTARFKIKSVYGVGYRIEIKE